MSKDKLLSTSIDIINKYVKESNSFSEVLKKIGYLQIGKKSIINKLQKICDDNNIDTTHLSKDTYIFPEKIICTECNKEKTTDNFYISGNKIHHVCKDCVRKKEKQKYYTRQEKLNELKRNLSCKKCGEDRFYLLDFHHLNPEEKDYCISDNPHAKIETLQEEINKCIVLCSNCHREFHYINKKYGINIDDYLKLNNKVSQD